MPTKEAERNSKPWSLLQEPLKGPIVGSRERKEGEREKKSRGRLGCCCCLSSFRSTSILQLQTSNPIISRPYPVTD